MSDWRIYVFEADGNGGMSLVDGDLRATAEPTRELSASGSISLKIKPEQDVKLRPWKSVIVTENERELQLGIVSDMADDGDGSLSVTCAGVTGYWDTEPADVEWAARDADPARVLRNIYSWAQSQTGKNLGMDFAGYEDSGIRIGTPDPPVTRPVRRIRRPRIERIPPEPNKKAYKDYYLKGNKSAQVARRKAARDKYTADMVDWRKRRKVVIDKNNAETKRYKDEGEAYKKAVDDYQQAIKDAIYRVQWWENPTVGSVSDDMTKHVEYRTETRWNGDRPDTRIVIDKRIGAKRPTLRFVVGENVIDPPPVDWAGESYATRVVFLGSGEGKKMIRAEAVASRHGGLARTVFISDKSVRSKAAARKRAERALKWRQAMPLVTEIKVIDDDNARFGTFNVGDEIRLIDSSGRWAGTIDMWVRILAITETTEAPVATLTVTRSDKGE